ncbi:hypothetical protein [uncultured Anaerococcus sp.]|uniref:hypothetical protein n=1 Tax=Anaerococcus sp. AH8042_DFU013_CI05 TaxID=3385202 RepID=UPI0025E01877|nr:hypothetical protein [uncultured Anaerococcus sp.]
MAKTAKKTRRNIHRKPNKRSLFIFPYVIMALLIIGIPFGIYQFYISNVNRTVDGLEKAIKTYDTEYMENNTERLPIILEVLRTSYSDDGAKQEDFYNNNFENLDIEVESVEKQSRGKEVKLKISNVNYIDVYEKIEDSEDDEKTHGDYMVALSDPNQELNTREATIFLNRKINGYEINESRDFINAILGGALEYAQGSEKTSDSDKSSSPEATDSIDDAINND